MSNYTFKPGQTSIPAVWLNDVNKAINAPVGMLNGKRTLTPDGIIIVRNDSGANLGIDAVLGISGSVIDPADNPAEFAARPVFIGITPTADHVGKFVVLREPIANGGYGEAWVSGHFATQINVVSEADTTADASVDGNATMYSTSGGIAQILWKESGTGVKRAVVRIGGGGASTPAKFLGSLQVVTCPKAEVEGALVDLPPDEGVNTTDSLCVDGDGRWVRVTAVTADDVRRSDYTPSFSIAFGLEATGLASWAFAPAGTGCGVHALQTQWDAWTDDCDAWAASYAVWLATDRSGTEPMPPELTGGSANEHGAALLAMILERATHPTEAAIIASHEAWADGVRIDAFLTLYETWRTGAWSTFVADWTAWIVLWNAWHAAPVGDEPTAPAYPADRPANNDALDDSADTGIVAFVADLATFDGDLTSFKGAVTAWDHESEPPVPPSGDSAAPVAPEYTAPESIMEPDPDIDHTGNSTWLMGVWLGIVKLTDPTSDGSGGAFTLTASDCETSLITDASQGYGWMYASWVMCSECCGASGWYCVETDPGVFASQYYLCGPSLYIGGPYTTEEESQANGCECVGSYSKIAYVICELNIPKTSLSFVGAGKYDVAGYPSRDISIEIRNLLALVGSDVNGAFESSANYVISGVSDHSEFVHDGYDELISGAHQLFNNRFRVLTESSYAPESYCSVLYRTMQQPVISTLPVLSGTKTVNFKSGTTFTLPYPSSPPGALHSGMNLVIQFRDGTGMYETFTGCYVMIEDVEIYVPSATLRFYKEFCDNELVGTYTFAATYDCTSWWSVSFSSKDVTGDPTTDTGWVDDGMGGYTRTWGSACPPPDPETTPTCYYYWDASGECVDGVLYWTIYNTMIDTYGSVMPWTEQYSDGCNFYYSCVTTSATQPANPTGLNCDGCGI